MNLKKLLSQPQYDPIRDKKAERNLFARRALVSFIRRFGVVRSVDSESI